MEFEIGNIIEMKLIFNQIHQSKFHRNKSQYRHSQELRNRSVDDQKQCYHHHKNNAQKQIKLNNNHFIQMENELPNSEMNNECQEKYDTNNYITFVLHFLLYLKFRDV